MDRRRLARGCLPGIVRRPGAVGRMADLDAVSLAAPSHRPAHRFVAIIVRGDRRASGPQAHADSISFTENVIAASWRA